MKQAICYDDVDISIRVKVAGNDSGGPAANWIVNSRSKSDIAIGRKTD